MRGYCRDSVMLCLLVDWEKKTFLAMIDGSLESPCRVLVKTSTKVLYAAPNFLKMGIKMPRFVVFWTTLAIKDKKSAAKFHYITTVSGKVVAQSIAFRVVSIYWPGDDPFPLKSCLQVTCPLLSVVSYGRCQNS